MYQVSCLDLPFSHILVFHCWACESERVIFECMLLSRISDQVGGIRMGNHKIMQDITKENCPWPQCIPILYVLNTFWYNVANFFVCSFYWYPSPLLLTYSCFLAWPPARRWFVPYPSICEHYLRLQRLIHSELLRSMSIYTTHQIRKYYLAEVAARDHLSKCCCNFI